MADPLFLLDSNICIYLLEGLSDLARQRVEGCRPGEIATSAVAYAEVMRGLDPSNPAALGKADMLFRVVEVLPFGLEAAAAYQEMPFKRASFDRLIAAHALSRDMTLVTNNERDFVDIPRLRIQNWTRP